MQYTNVNQRAFPKYVGFQLLKREKRVIIDIADDNVTMTSRRQNQRGPYY